MDGLTGKKRAQRRVCRREKSGRSPFPALLRVEGGQGRGRYGGQGGLTAGSSCSPPSILTQCRDAEEGQALPALGSFPRLTTSIGDSLFPFPALPRNACPYTPHSFPPCRHSGCRQGGRLPPPRSHAGSSLPAPSYSGAEGRAAAPSYLLVTPGWKMLAHVRRVVQTGSGTCRIPRASPQALPPLRRTPPQRRPHLPKKKNQPGGLLEVKRGPGRRESPNQEEWLSGCSRELRCQIPFKGLFKQFKACSGSSEGWVAAPEHCPLPGRGAALVLGAEGTPGCNK